MADILGNDFKITALKILRELKQDVEKVKEKKCVQNINVNKSIENQKWNQKQILEMK